MLALILPAAALALATQGSDMERRPHFRLRLALISLSMPALLSLLVGGAALNVLPDAAAGMFLLLLIVLSIPGLMLVPTVLFHNPGPPDDGGDDGGSGPHQPPDPPMPPRGDLPLPRSEPGRWRLRDHDRPTPRSAPRRSPVPERRRERTLG